MLDFMQNYWGFIPLLILIFIFIKVFVNMPSAEQLLQVKKWLLWAVAQAEIELGSGTGKLKLSKVYGMFIEKFPWLVKVISFSVFSNLVDKVLEEFKRMIATNEKINEIVNRQIPLNSEGFK